MVRPGRGPPAVPSRWADIVEEAAQTAEAVREAGVDVELFHPGDVVPLPDEPAIDILLPGREFERLEAMAPAFEPDEVTVYTAREGAFHYAVVLARDGTDATAICCPLYLDVGAIDGLAAATAEAGAIDLHLRPLSRRARVVVSIDDPDLLFATPE